ncbi:DNA repair ATPase [Ornithinibacillus scapharcae]|uniref:DNA repair ATPase n=1 Tax=Ornithinibacillus scapharcae TaxID=1147159 RepID=UPI000225B135|nr:DNA repair ATPase [Ornithinibacillus scapharcae]
MEERAKELELLKSASPLEMTQKLEAFELHDRKSSQEIIDEVYKEFESAEHMTASVLRPVFTSVVDGLMELGSFGKSMRKKGLTATRIVNDCEAFSYEGSRDTHNDVDGYSEYKNADDNKTNYGEDNRKKYDRDTYEDKGKMKDYKLGKLKDGSKLVDDEYTGEKNKLYVFRDDPDKRRNDSRYDYQAEPDHIVPLENIHRDFKGNYGLTDEDIKRIANADYNLAVTSGKLNGSKLHDSNSEFIEKQEKKGKDGYKLDETTKQKMRDLEAQSIKAIRNEVDKTVGQNLVGKGNVDAEFKKMYGKRKLTDADKNSKEYKQLQRDKAKGIYKDAAGVAAEQAKDYAVGNAILYIVKPIYFELKDCFKHGLIKGVQASSAIEAFKIRFGRVKKFVLENVSGFLGDNVWEFVKNFISSLIEGIISLFVGVLRQVLKVLKEGIKIFAQSAKVLFGRDSKTMTPAQKGDAIIKILGGSVIAISGVGIEALLNKVGIGEPWSIVLSTFLSGIASALFMYLLDKADIFSVKAEKRRDRIVDIFNERIKDIKAATESFNVVAIEALRKQYVKFNGIQNKIQSALDKDDINSINNGLYEMAGLFEVDLGYSNTDEFVKYFDSVDVVKL